MDRLIGGQIQKFEFEFYDFFSIYASQVLLFSPLSMMSQLNLPQSSKE